MMNILTTLAWLLIGLFLSLMIYFTARKYYFKFKIWWYARKLAKLMSGYKTNKDFNDKLTILLADMKKLNTEIRKDIGPID